MSRATRQRARYAVDRATLTLDHVATCIPPLATAGALAVVLG